MLEIEIPEQEIYDESTSTFIPVKAAKLKFEHSLVSISKWESKWHKPFPFINNNKQMTSEEFIDFLKMMCITQNVPDETFRSLPSNALKEIVDYMDNLQTATTFKEDNKKGNGGKFITSELIYCWMTQLNIWKECEKWHINRLLTLIHICSVENAPKKKMSKDELYSRQRALNQARRKPKKPR